MYITYLLQCFKKYYLTLAKPKMNKVFGGHGEKAIQEIGAIL